MTIKDTFSKKELKEYIYDPYKIAEATYTLYLESLRQESLISEYIDSPDSSLLKSKIQSAHKKQELYHTLKEIGISQLINTIGLRSIGYHYCLDQCMLRDYYEFGGYGFHSDGWYSMENLGNYNKYPYQNKKESMSIEMAQQLLEYIDISSKIEEKISEVYNLINTLPEKKRKELHKRAIKDKNPILQYLLINNSTEETYDLMEMSSKIQLEKEG